MSTKHDLTSLEKSISDKLKSLGSPALYICNYDINELKLKSRLDEDINLGYIDGKSITGKQQMLDEVSQALSFPDYFGKNLDALWDSLTDLSWLDKKPITLVISDADTMIAANSEISATLLEMLRDAAKEWAKKIDKSSGWDKGFWRDARPFKAVLLVKDHNNKQLKELLDKIVSPGDWHILEQV